MVKDTSRIIDMSERKKVSQGKTFVHWYEDERLN